MRNLILCLSLLFSGACALWGQTQLTTPARVLPKADSSAAGILVMQNNVATVNCIPANYTSCDPVTMQNGTNAQGLLVVAQDGTVSMSTESILPIGDNTSDLGSTGASAKRWANINSVIFFAPNGLSTSEGCWVLTFAIGCGPNAITPTVTLDRVAGTVTATALAGSGTVCLQTNNSGVIAKASAGCGTMTNPLTTTGDIIYSSSGTTAARLGIGTAGQCLLVSGGIPAWGACGGGGGANTSLSNLSSVSINANLGFNADNTYNIGAASGTTRTAPNSIYASTIMESPRFRLAYPGAGSTTNYFDWINGNNFFSFSDSSANAVLLYDATAGLSSAFWQVHGRFQPLTTNTWDLGCASCGTFGAPVAWRTGYFYDARLINLGGGGTDCLNTDNDGDITPANGACVTDLRTISTTSPLGGGGALSSNLTLTCTTCVTTAGGQSIAGTTTLSTASISTAISGTYNLSGNETVTGNWYARTFSGGDASCGGVANGWMGVRTDTNEIQICIGSAMKKIGLI